MQTKRAERIYSKQLARLANNIGQIIKGFDPKDLNQASALQDMLRRYAEALGPWASKVASVMLADVDTSNAKGWRFLSDQVSKGIAREIVLAPAGQVMQKLLSEQVSLIKSLPLDAAKRVHEWTLKGIEDSTRASEVAKQIMRSGEVTKSRAMTIARTEVARTGSTLTEARAKQIGATHYIWHTSHDGDVRKDHKYLDGKVFAWNDPPIADQASGARANPGCIFNCRCWAEPIIND